MPKSPAQPPANFGMNMSDDAAILFTGQLDLSTGNIPFHDVGFMPVNQLTLAGNPLHLPPGLDHFFISYHGDGVQNMVTGSIHYTSLDYDLIGYKGPNATFSVAGGTPMVTGANNQTVLAHGTLIANAGNLTITWTDATHTAISNIDGEVDTMLKVGNQTVGKLDIAVHHAGTDVAPILANGQQVGLTLDHGSLTATYFPLSGS